MPSYTNAQVVNGLAVVINAINFYRRLYGCPDNPIMFTENELGFVRRLLEFMLQYQSESFNGTVHQLNQEPQVYLPSPLGSFTPSPNNMFRGRGNCDVNSYYNERFNSKRINRWDARDRISKKGQKQDNRKRCLISTKSHTATSKDCIGVKDKTNDKCKDSAPDRPRVATKAAQKNVANDVPEKGIIDKDSLTDECDKIKDSKKEKKISEVKDNGEVERQNVTETDATSSNLCGIVHFKPNTEINSVTDMVSSKTNNNNLVEEIFNNDLKQNKTDDENSTHKANPKGVDLERSLENVFAEPFLVIDDDSPKSEKGCRSKRITHTPLSDERTDEEQKASTCHSLPLEFPTWERSYSPTITQYQNPYMSVREIESDEETICYDQFVTLDSIDTTKSYLGMCNFGPEFDDYRVTDMTMSTPSPVKRKNSDEDENVMIKKTKYDRLYAEINSDQLLNEINEVLKEDKKNESIITRCIKRYRSKSLSTMPPKEKAVLRRWGSSNSIDQNHYQVTCNFDLKTNLLVLLGNKEPSPIGDLKPHCNIVKNTDTQKEDTNDSIVKKLDRNESHEGSSNGRICKENEKENIKKVTENGTESVTNKAKGKSTGGKIEINQVCKENELKRNVDKIKDQTKLVQDEAPPIKCGESVSKDEHNHKGIDIRMDQKSMSNDQVSRENAPKCDVDLKTTKPHSLTDSQRNTEGSSDKEKKTTEDRRKEKRTNDEANKAPGSAKILPIDGNQVSTTDNTKKSSSLVRYSDYKKSVDLLKKTPPPEMSLCTMIGSPKKLISRRMTFSNENELHLQKMFRLFGNDFFEDLEMDNKCDSRNGDNKVGDNKSDNRKRKCEKDAGTHQREPQPKKLFSEPSDQCVPNAKNLDTSRRYSMPGSSTSEGSFKPPCKVEVTKAQGSNNTLQKVPSATAIEKPKQPSSSHSSYKITHKSKSIDKSKRRPSTPVSSGGNKYLSNKNRIPMPLSSLSQVASSSQKTHKPDDDRKKDKSSKSAKPENSSRHESNSVHNTETSKDEKSQLNIDIGKGQSSTNEKDSRKQGKPAKSRTNPRVVTENISKKTKDGKEGKPSKVIDKHNKPSSLLLPHNNAAKGETHKLNKDLHKNILPKVTNAKQNPTIVQKQSSHSKVDNNNPSTNSTALQPQLVLNRIDDQIPNIGNTKQKELPIEEAIESFVPESNYVTATTLVKDRFPMMQKIRFSVTENECCDRATTLESADVTDKMDTMTQLVTSSKVASKQSKEPSDDVIEIKPDIPVIDLTDDGSDVKEEKVEDPPKTEVVLKPDKKEDTNLAIDKPERNNSEERITLYRSDETLNNTLEVQAMVASILSNALRNNNSNKKCDVIKLDKCDVIKSDDKPVVAVEDKTTPANPVVSTTSRTLPVSIPQEVPLNNSNSVASELLIERAIADAISQREQQRTLGVPHQATHVSENNVDARSVSTVAKLSSSPQRPTTQVHFNTTTRSPRRTENNSSEQNLVTQTPRQRDSNTPPVIYNVLVGNRRTVNSPNNQSSYSKAPGSSRIENSPQVNFNLAVGTENSNGSQNTCAAAQTPIRIETAGAPIAAGIAQKTRVESSSKEQDIVSATNLRRADCSTTREISSVVPCSVSDKQNVPARAVSLAGQSPRQNNNSVDGPLRALQQLTNGVEPTGPNGNRQVGCVGLMNIGLILIRYLYYLDGVKKAQMAYSEQIKKMAHCLPTLVKTELILFENNNSAKFYMLSNELAKDLKLINTDLLSNCSSRIQLIMQSVYRSIRVEVPTLTMSWVYLMLEALMKPEATQYSEVPFLAALYRHVLAIATHIRHVCEQNQAAAQNNAPPRDPLTPEQRKLLEKQLLQYKAIRNNQVILFSMGNTLQTNLLKAHQNNQVLKENQQNNNASGVIDVHPPNPSGGSVNVQLYDVPGPPNVSLSGNNNIPRNPVVPQQDNSCTTNSETLKSILLSTSSSKKSATCLTSQTSKQTGAGTSSSSNSKTISDIPKTPRTISRTSRRNSSPSTFKLILPPRKAPDGTNENFRIRLPFTMPYDISSSPSRTTTVAQHPPRSTIPISGTNLSMSSPVRNTGAIPPAPPVIQNPGATPTRLSVLQNPGATPNRFSMAQNPGATPYRQNSGVTPSKSSMVRNYGAAPSTSSRVPNSGASPSTSSKSSNSGANLSVSSRVPNSSATPSMSSRIQNSGATPSTSMIQSLHLSMPLLDENVPSAANVPNLSHIQSVGSRTPVYAPIIPLVHSIRQSPSPPLEVISDNDEVSVVDSRPVQEEEAVLHSTSAQIPNEDSSQAVKNEKEQQLPNEIETVDLTWLDDVDPEQLQNEIEFIEVKKEEAIEVEFMEDDNRHQDPIGMALSPTDSGISSPNVQVEYNEQVFSDRTCICGEGAEYVCGCRMAMYCSESCQLKDWKTHKEVCLKHSAKSVRDTSQS